MKVLCFGIIKEIVGSSSHEIDLPENADVSSLKEALFLEFPDLREIKSIMVAVNQEYALDSDKVLSIHEIALIPPVSGG